MSRRELLTGTVGGIIGTIMVVIGIIWVWFFTVDTFSTEIADFVAKLDVRFNLVLGFWSAFYGYPFPYPIPYYPSASLFFVLSFILSMFLIATGALIGVGFHGAYKIGGGATGLYGLIFSIIGITSGALLIVLGILTNVYEEGLVWLGGENFFAAFVPMPNIQVIWISFIILGATFILLSSASISIREMTAKPLACIAAGILSFIGGLFLFIGSGVRVFFLIVLGEAVGGVVPSEMLITGFGLMFVAFILWAVVFYSSRKM